MITHLFLVALGLRCCEWAFSSCREQMRDPCPPHRAQLWGAGGCGEDGSFLQAWDGERVTPSESGKTVGNGDRDRRQAQSRDGELRVSLTRGQSFLLEGAPQAPPLPTQHSSESATIPASVHKESSKSQPEGQAGS